jgi:hypothetical protein
MKRAMIVLHGFLGLGLMSARGDSFYEAPLDTRKSTEARLVGGVTATRMPEGVRIAFEVSGFTDVEVAVLDGKDRVVRHLAAGLLGPHAPAPLQAGTLKQELPWDGRDDAGRTVLGMEAGDDSTKAGTHRIRVRIGAMPRLEKVLGRNPNALDNIVGLAVGSGGDLYVLTGIRGPAGGRRLRVFDRQGRYLRTIMPYSAQTPVERTERVGHLMIDGQRVPIVFNGHSMSLYPLIPNMPRQSMAWNSRGYLVAASAADSPLESGLPRHLLAFDPRGGAPKELDFAGPELSVPVGMMRGLGRSLYKRFDNVVCSPDGQYVYYTGGDTMLGSDYYSQPSRHAVFRFRWDEDKHKGVEEPFYGTDGRPGNEDGYLNNPRGMAVDADGNLFICDRNNNRIMIVSPEGVFLDHFPVRDPEQIAVHPKTGAIYTLCRPPDPPWRVKDHAPMGHREYGAWKKRVQARQNVRIRIKRDGFEQEWEPQDAPRPPARIAKFSRWSRAAAPREICFVEGDIELMALDAEATPAWIWVSRNGRLDRYADQGERLVPASPTVDRTPGLVRPGHLVADPEYNRVLVCDGGSVLDGGKVVAVNIETGQVSAFIEGIEVGDMDRAPDGTFCIVERNALRRLDRNGRPIPLTPGGADKAAIGGFHPLGDAGRSLTVAPNGDIYLMRIAGEKGIQNRVDVFGPDGRRKQAALIDGLGIGDAGLGVDARGNVYVGVNVKPASRPLPPPVRGKVPESNWLSWVQWVDQFREPPWYYSMRNEYIYHYGSVMKFGPEGGTMYGRSPGASLPFIQSGGRDRAAAAFAENGPPDAPAYRSGYLYHPVKIKGGQWRFAGTGIVPASERYWGDAACVCYFSRLDADLYGRVFAPDCFLFRVHILDANGNRIGEVGRYGNADDTHGKQPHFAWPAFVHAGVDGKLYVSDGLNGGIVVVGFDYADRGSAKLPAALAAGRK